MPRTDSHPRNLSLAATRRTALSVILRGQSGLMPSRLVIFCKINLPSFFTCHRPWSIEWVWCQPAVRVREHGSWFRSAGLARPDFWVFNESMSRRADRALSRVRLFVSGLEPFVKLSWIPLAASVITIYEPAARYFFIGLLRLFSAAGPNLARAPSFFNRIINEFRPARFNYRLYTVEAELLSCKS